MPVGARRAGRLDGVAAPGRRLTRLSPCLVLEMVSPRPRHHPGPCDGEQPGRGSLDSLSRGSPAFEPRGLLRGLDQGTPVLVASQSDACQLGGVTSVLQGAG